MIEEALQLKLVTIGDSGVGKSWLLTRWANENAKLLKASTIGIEIGLICIHNSLMKSYYKGVDFKMKNVEIDGKRVKLQIWDTAGQERYRTITASYYRNAQGILLVYDVTDRNSFNNVRNWMSQIHANADLSINKILVGNKCDLIQQRTVSHEEGEALAAEYKIPFIETSAVSNVNVNEAFMTIAKLVYTRISTTDSKPLSGRKDDKRKISAISSDDFNGKKTKKRSWCSII